MVDWIDSLRRALPHSAWAAELDFEGISIADVLVSPLYLGMLDTLRRTLHSMPNQQPARNDRWRGFAYKTKKHLAEVGARLQATPIRSSQVLFWPREITHLQGQVPVAEAMVEHGKSCAFFACQPRVQSMLRRRSWPAASPFAAWPEEVKKSRREGARRAERLAKSPLVDLPAIAKTPVDPKLLAEALRARLVELLPTACESVANARLALQRFNPRALVLGNDITLEGRAGALVARQQRVPTAVLMHGIFAANDIQRLHAADSILVYGQSNRRAMLAAGIENERIAVTGAPYLDQRPVQTGRINPQLAHQLQIPDDAPMILVATSGAGHSISLRHHQTVIRELARLSATLPEAVFVVKLHRKDRVAHYGPILKELPGAKLRVVAHGTPGYPALIFDWLQGCRILLTGSSTVALEAMLMDVPVVTMDFCGELKGVDFIDAGATWHVTTREDLEQAVRRILASDGSLADLTSRAEAFLRDAFASLDRQASARCAETIEKLGEI